MQDLPHRGRSSGEAGLRQLTVDPAVSPQRIVLRQPDDEACDARDRRRAAGLAPLARVVLSRGQLAVPGQQRRGCHGKGLCPAPAGNEPGQRGEPRPAGLLVPYAADVAAQHRVLVPEHQQFSSLRPVFPVQDVVVRVGDTRFAPEHLTAGAWGTATALSAVHKALRELRKQLGTGDTGTVDVAAAVRATGHGSPEVEVTSLGQGQPPEMLDRSRAGLVAPAGPIFPNFTAFSWAAHFVEVLVEATTRRISVPGRSAWPTAAGSPARSPRPVRSAGA